MQTPVYIITLNPKAKNTLELEESLSAQGINAHLFPGVDGRNEMPPLEKNETINQKKSLAMRFVELSSTEVGCYLSHLRAIKGAYYAGLEKICILEDDVLIENTFSETLSEIEKLPGKVEFIRLMGLKNHKRKIISPLDKTHNLIRPIKGLCGTQGYVVTRSGMKKIISHGNLISEPIDKFYDHFWEIDLHCYAIEPHLIWERSNNTSSVIKPAQSLPTNPIIKTIKKTKIKWSRSAQHYFYIFQHSNLFLPATKVKEKQGKTKRIH